MRRTLRASTAGALGAAALMLCATDVASAAGLEGTIVGTSDEPPFAQSDGPADPPGCDPTGTSVVSFQTTAPTSGEYPGTITTSGSMTIGPQALTPPSATIYDFEALTGDILTVTGSFEIVSGDTIVTGTFTGPAPDPLMQQGQGEASFGSCYGVAGPALGYPDLATGTLIGNRMWANYTGTVAGPGGVGEVSGVLYLAQRQTGGFTPTVNVTSWTGPWLVFVDSTPPVLNPTVTPNPVTQGQAATVTPNASDAESDLAGVSCDEVDTSQVGTFTVTCQATNSWGLTTVGSAEYEVVAPMPPGPVTAEDCKRGGWATFVNPSFRNQGDCVSYVVSNRPR